MHRMYCVCTTETAYIPLSFCKHVLYVVYVTDILYAVYIMYILHGPYVHR